ncbi:VIT1/CCC1 transporter family protein [Patescibacteria group bacterium]|nr:VIT1/CCC1 transporter family protein [Patescibacteria group bacterium]
MSMFNHQQKINTGITLREVVFGLEDGMVSTLGAITGIAIGSQDKPTVLLAGIVIIAVESISMGIGSYLANKSQQSADKQKLTEEKIELSKFPDEEKTELHKMFLRDGWSKELASQMMSEANSKKRLMLTEMAYRELQVPLSKPMNAIKNGVYMYFSYILGGIVPLSAYFLLTINQAIPVSTVVTLLGLFLLGVATVKYTNERWFVSGIRVLTLGGIALLVGLLVGKLFSVSH